MGQISTKTHGILDYGMVVILLLVPRVLQFQSQLTTLMTILAITTLLYSLSTHYERGILPIIPTRLHLIADCMGGIILCVLAFSLKLVGSEHNALLLLGIWGILIALMTPSRSPLERMRIKQIRDMHQQSAVTFPYARHDG